MCLPTKHRLGRICCLLATLLFAVGFTIVEAEAGKPASLGFTIKAEHEQLSDLGTYTSTGAIQDAGTYETEWHPDPADPYETLIRLRFTSSNGTFYIGWLPTNYMGYIEPKVEHPIELMPGTGDYTDLHGTGTLKMRTKYVYGWDDWGGWYIDYTIDHITIKGTLLP